MNIFNTLLGLSRVAFGVVGFVAPGTMNSVSAKRVDPLANMVMRGLSARDAALGWGILAAKNPSERRRWLIAAAIADLGDVTWASLGWSRLKSPARYVMLGLALSAAVGEIASSYVSTRAPRLPETAEQEETIEEEILIIQPGPGL